MIKEEDINLGLILKKTFITKNRTMMIVDIYIEKVSHQNIKIARINIMELKLTGEEMTDHLQAETVSNAEKKVIFREIA
jgi:hypothetical protein